jgi:acyl-CoA synthetase (AMP-forming)/AMP-acid ligase II/acyl carrier protein
MRLDHSLDRSSDTLLNLILGAAQAAPDAPAILDLTRAPLTYSQLAEQVTQTGAWLRARGIGRTDRIALCLPNGPEAATAFLGVANVAICAPLNPHYQQAEFSFFLQDLQANALILTDRDNSVARIAAESLDIPVFWLFPSSTTAGAFILEGPDVAAPLPFDAPTPGATALILHTSGTTARPKQAPLRHTNLVHSAFNVGRTLNLTGADRCLNIMPLFHIHGLVAALLASLSAGGQVVCTPGFDGLHFLKWLADWRATWYTAVPTMHQAIVVQAARSTARLDNTHLRFIRSSSAPLSPQICADLERSFGVPVIEAYGMTEAAHQIASNPLPPQTRKPGTVGLAAGPQIAIMAEERDELLGVDIRGEIVIRGANVIDGYFNHPEANAAAFVNGWFRTGDQGFLDADGYLTITGRIKELINRGGEKIAPREVDEALLAHPGVAQALAFALPDPHLGEVVAAVVKPAAPDLTEDALRDFVAQRLAYFKAPQRIFFVTEIPVGSTGKFQRIGLAARLGLTTQAAPAEPQVHDFVAPRNQVEQLLATLWCEQLALPAVSVHDHFLAVGGDSILAMRLVAALCQMLQIELSLATFFAAPTIAEQAALVERALLQEPPS